MTRMIFEWIWRAALVGALAWIGWELHQIRVDMLAPDDSQSASAPADPQDEQPDVREELALLNQKIDAIMRVMMRSK